MQAVDGHRLGNALSNCHPRVERSERVLEDDLGATPEFAQSRAIEVEILAPGGTLRLVAAHFGLTIRERRQQALRLVAIARRHPTTTVMLGDFNEWFWPASLRGALGRELPARTRFATFPSWYPLFRLDRIFCWPPDAMRASFVDRDARRVSDHLPVIADIAIG